jgi:flagellar basal body-associated protein FliL
LVLIILVCLGGVFFFSVVIVTFWYLAGRRNICHWGHEFKRISEVVRLHEAEDRVPILRVYVSAESFARILDNIW